LISSYVDPFLLSLYSNDALEIQRFQSFLSNSTDVISFFQYEPKLKKSVSHPNLKISILYPKDYELLYEQEHQQKLMVPEVGFASSSSVADPGKSATAETIEATVPLTEDDLILTQLDSILFQIDFNRPSSLPSAFLEKNETNVEIIDCLQIAVVMKHSTNYLSKPFLVHHQVPFDVNPVSSFLDCFLLLFPFVQ
jgi:hypothetical protein